MARTNVYRYDERDGKTLDGWFDPSSAERFEENRRWNGSNHIGVMSGGQAGYEELYHTKGGRWVRHYDFTSEYNGPECYEFLTSDAARDWLIKNQSDDAVKRFFGELEEERGPGRPEVGPATNVRLGDALTVRLDAARQPGESRAAAIRRLLEAALQGA